MSIINFKFISLYIVKGSEQKNVNDIMKKFQKLKKHLNEGTEEELKKQKEEAEEMERKKEEYRIIEEKERKKQQKKEKEAIKKNKKIEETLKVKSWIQYYLQIEINKLNEFKDKNIIEIFILLKKSLESTVIKENLEPTIIISENGLIFSHNIKIMSIIQDIVDKNPKQPAFKIKIKTCSLNSDEGTFLQKNFINSKKQNEIEKQQKDNSIISRNFKKKEDQVSSIQNLFDPNSEDPFDKMTFLEKLEILEIQSKEIIKILENEFLIAIKNGKKTIDVNITKIQNPNISKLLEKQKIEINKQEFCIFYQVDVVKMIKDFNKKSDIEVIINNKIEIIPKKGIFDLNNFIQNVELQTKKATEFLKNQCKIATQEGKKEIEAKITQMQNENISEVFQEQKIKINKQELSILNQVNLIEIIDNLNNNDTQDIKIIINREQIDFVEKTKKNNEIIYDQNLQNKKRNEKKQF